MHTRVFLTLAALLSFTCEASATIFGQIRGVVHDAQHRPVSGAQVDIQAASSSLHYTSTTGSEGTFTVPLLPLGGYTITAKAAGFASEQQAFTLASGTAPVLHFELHPGTVEQAIDVEAASSPADSNSATPTTLISRNLILQTPGADRTNSLAAITDQVPGAYITHDQLHIRGGHQVSWLIDGVQIPNTNIASNLGVQIDPKDIDYVEVHRGSYTADLGDRTYAIFDVVPRTGFGRDREAELIFSAGSFLQTNDQLSLGDHTEKLAYYVSLNGNRSDFGLSTPTASTLHDAANGYGGFASIISNRTPSDQLRAVGQLRRDFFQIPYDPDPTSFGNQQFDSSGLRDGQHEVDSLAEASWLHTFSNAAVLQLSPFFHENRAGYEGSAADIPVATSLHRTSTYGGLQASATGELFHNMLQAGLYSYGQHDSSSLGASFNDGTGTPAFQVPASAAGGVVETYISDNIRASSWLTLIAGLRETHFQGDLTEDEISPRFGAALRIPQLHWVLRGFYGRFYQPPPLLTAAGPVVQFANSNNTGFAPLRGERDEEHQFGVQIPYRGWLLDVDNFRTRVNNFLDHSVVGNSSIYFPVTIDGALIRAWELTLRSPRLPHAGQLYLNYSNQIAQQRGAITGGLICAPVASPQCDVSPEYHAVDHDQRNTLNVGFNTALPWKTSASANISYGSGFTNGKPDPATPYPDAYLPAHSSVDLSLTRSFGERTAVSVTALNLAKERKLLDNSLTFGGFHFSDPREVYAEVRYRFHF